MNKNGLAKNDETDLGGWRLYLRVHKPNLLPALSDGSSTLQKKTRYDQSHNLSQKTDQMQEIPQID